MKVIRFAKELHRELKQIKQRDKSIGFVPTMGALHQGHLSLIEKAKQENDIVVCSIFVNPTQFNNSSDLDTYPISIEQDKALLLESQCDFLYLPTVEDVYPQGPISDSYMFSGIEHEMEGKHRPGHFDGVATVVKRLFDICIPDRAYFGEKDFQQLRIIQELISQTEQRIEIIPCSIFREQDGLAMSSRNRKLSQTQREQAPEIYKALKHLKENLKYNDISDLLKNLKHSINKQSELELEYIEVADISSLKSASNIQEDHKYRAFIAVFAGDIRLIDNIALNY
ncbi:MAG: pantoate--beta-alanine ligase [Flavobacteriaceae bacterium]